jgi:hypothetical protein
MSSSVVTSPPSSPELGEGLLAAISGGPQVVLPHRVLRRATRRLGSRRSSTHRPVPRGGRLAGLIPPVSPDEVPVDGPRRGHEDLQPAREDRIVGGGRGRKVLESCGIMFSFGGASGPASIRSTVVRLIQLIHRSVGWGRPFGLLDRFHRGWSAGLRAEVPEAQGRRVARPGRFALGHGEKPGTLLRWASASNRWLHCSVGCPGGPRFLWSCHWSSILRGAAETAGTFKRNGLQLEVAGRSPRLRRFGRMIRCAARQVGEIAAQDHNRIAGRSRQATGSWPNAHRCKDSRSRTGQHVAYFSCSVRFGLSLPN